MFVCPSSRKNKGVSVSNRSHKRSGSAGFFNHRRTQSSDLTFLLNATNINQPQTIQKVTQHRRVPSGVAKVSNIGEMAFYDFSF